MTERFYNFVGNPILFLISLTIALTFLCVVVAIISDLLKTRRVKVSYRIGTTWVAEIEAGSVKSAERLITVIAPGLPLVRKVETDLNNSTELN